MTSIEPGSGWADRLNPRNWTLTWKLVVVGLVPALLALALGVLRIADDAEQAAELSRSSRVVEIRDQVAGAANALRQERDESTLYVAGNRTGDRGVLEIGHGQTDGEIDEMVNALRGTGELDPATVAALRRVEEGLGQVAPLRADVTDNPAVPSDQVVSRYSELIGPIDVLDRALLRQLRTPATAGLADAITAVTGAVEQLSVEHTVLGAVIRSGGQLPGDGAVLNVAAARLQADYQDYRAAVTPEQLARFGAFLDEADNARRDQLKAAILAAPGGQAAVPATEWDAAYSGSRAAADRTAEQVRGELVAASTAAENRASNLAGINSVILMLGLLIGITIAVLVSRGLVRSLRVLRTSALDVAERRLPQTVESVRAGDTPDITVAPVPLTGRDEVVQVARAFDAVHMQAIRLAADQATLQAGISAMFVNLSRRSQALVERQLQLIEQLEANEQDADQLSNLFQLDHLATRMRRNSENLLVLAGTDVAKRNVAAVPMVDVLRAAVSEVEQYQRIVVQSPPSATILGRSASDIVHLLAELLDNATNFSPPDSQVVMSSTRTADGAIVVEIADRGVGMTDDELAAANSRLSGPSSVDVSTSRRMGLIVVGRLATRHGVDVRLSTSAAGGSGSGLTASVTVPTKLVPTTEPRRSGALAGSGMARQPGGPSAAGLPPQRNGQTGLPAGAPLAALVAGSDGPVDAGAPPLDKPPATPPHHAPNGSVNGLPTRQPGSSLRAAGSAPFESWQPEPPRPAAEPPVTDGAGGDAPVGPPADRPAADGPRVDRPVAADQAPDQPGRDQAPRDQGPRDQAPRDQAPRDQAPRDQAPRDQSPRDQSPRDQSPRDQSPRDQALRDQAPRDQAPRDQAPRDQAPRDQAPRDQVPRDQAPRDQALRGQDPRDQAPRDRVDDDAEPSTPPTGSPVIPAAPRPGVLPVPPGARPHGRDNGQDNGRGPDTDPTPRLDPLDSTPGPRRPSPQRRPAGPRPFPRDGVPNRPAADRGPAPQPSGGLFSSPATDTPASPMPALPASRPTPEPGVRPGPRFDPNETTPIFEEIASAWFRSNRSVPVQYGPDQEEPQPPAPAPAPPRPTPAPAREPSRPMPLGGTAAPQPSRPVPPAPAPAPAPAPVAVPAEPVGADHGFASLADEGWRAARGATVSRGDELTPAGLPKRRPRARLVPGSAGSAVLAPLAAPTRSAESIRGRLSSYQQGVRLGRENRQRGEAESTPQPNDGTAHANAHGNHDEESS